LTCEQNLLKAYATADMSYSTAMPESISYHRFYNTISPCRLPQFSIEIVNYIHCTTIPELMRERASSLPHD